MRAHIKSPSFNNEKVLGVILFERTMDSFIEDKYLTTPSKPDFYLPLLHHPKVVRVVTLSGGYSRVQANEKLAQNHRLCKFFPCSC
jgi:fructose-bisphosphate aldolase class 1